MEILSPDEIRNLQESSFIKHTKFFEEQTKGISKKVMKIIKKQIKAGKKDPYIIHINCRKKSLDVKDIVNTLRKNLLDLESHWYIAIRVLTERHLYDSDITITNGIRSTDCGLTITVSERPITCPANHYSTKKESSVCNCTDKKNCKTCVICDINHVKSIALPCGCAKYCWECIDRIEKCAMCRSIIVERRNVNV